MRIQSLRDLPLAQLVETFNESFTGYFVPIQMSEELLAEKIRVEDIDLGGSMGVFDKNQLVGFTLVGLRDINGELCGYNAGTGVIPEYRGQRLPGQMYDLLKAALKPRGLAQLQLEVISKNTPAIRSYRRSGMQISRLLDCFQGKIEHLRNRPNDVVFEQIPMPDDAVLKALREVEPSWQDTHASAQKRGSKCLAILRKEEIVGYALYHRNRVSQLAVRKDQRRRGLATLLLYTIQEEAQAPLKLMNIDTRAESVSAFLNYSGLSSFIRQYEMIDRWA